MNFKLRPTNHTSFYFPEVTSIPATEPSQYLELERQSELAHDYSGLPHMTGAAVIPLMMAAQRALRQQ